jgi:phospholipid/cholesterol/gamma-HCH transport system substrate-binding protein
MTRNVAVRDFLTGLLALSAIVGLCALLILFGEMAELGRSFYRFQIILPSAGGLGPTSPVMVNGVKVGQVEDAEVAPRGAVLTLRVREGVRIPRAAVLSIEKGLIGDASLEFAVSHMNTASLAPSDFIADGEVFETTARGSAIDRLAESIQRPLDRLTASADRIDTLADTWTRTGQRLNELLAPRTTAEVDAGQSATIASTIARLDAALASANRWLADETLKNNVQGIASRANAVLDDLRTFLASWTETADSVDLAAQEINGATKNINDRMGELADQALGTLRRLDAAAAELGKTLEGANKGEGTIGQLVTNPDLYRSLNSAARRLDRLLEEMQLLVEQLKVEGIRLRL